MSHEIERVRAALADLYAVEREVGRGAMATVYLARDLKHDRRVAVKVLHGDLELGPERFLREIDIAAHLSHPHILPLYDSGASKGVLYYVMPYVEDETLGERLAREGPLPFVEAARLARQVARALAYAHDQGIVHRDIKPSNILLSAGQAVVSDFGVATAVTHARLTVTGAVVGTFSYMSPEQASGEEVDGRSDLYGLGCVLYEMLTGERAFHDPSPAVIIAQHLKGPVPSPSALRDEVPVALEHTVQTALAKAPDDRFADGDAFAEALTLAVRSEDGSSAWLRVVPNPLRPIMRRKVVEWGLTYVAAAWLVIQVVGTLAEVWPISREMQRGIQVLLGLGLFAMMGLTWLHARQGSRNIRGPVLLGVAAACAGAAGLLSLFTPDVAEADPEDNPVAEIEGIRTESTNRARPRVAVLLFDHLGNESDDRFVTDGLHEEIIGELHKISSLEVVGGRTSVLKYVESPMSIREIARDMDVDYVVEGRTLTIGARVELSVQLLSGLGEGTRWSEDYDREFTGEDFWEIADDVATSVARAIEAVILPAEQARVQERPTENDEALFAYLQGRHYWNLGTPDGFTQAQTAFETAIRSDPGFAEAYSGLADVFNNYGSYFFGPSSETFAIAKARAMTALVHDENLAEGYASMGYAILNGEWDWEGAEAAFVRALELNPNYVTAHVWYGQLLAYSGRHVESLDHLRRAVDLDPNSSPTRTALGWGLYLARRYEEALTELEAGVALDPRSAQAKLFAAIPLIRLGQEQRAIAEIEEAIDTYGRHSPYLVMLAIAYANGGLPDEATAIAEELEEMNRQIYVPDDFLAVVYSHLGRHDEAFERLEAAYEERSYGLIYLAIAPSWDPLRGDPRFADFLARVGP